MNKLPSILLFTGISFAAFWIWLGTMHRFEAPVPSFFFLVIYALPLVVGLFVGSAVSAVSKRSRGKATGLAFTYVVIVLAWVGHSYYSGEVFPACQEKVKRAYMKSPSVSVLEAWCVDKPLLRRILWYAEGRQHRESFDWILARGVTHANPDCVRLGISAATHDLDETQKLLAQGVSPNCRSSKNTPISRFFYSTRSYSGKGQVLLERLLAADASIEPGHLLIAIETANYPLLRAALEHVDPNVEADKSSKVRSSKIRNPLELAMHKSDIQAIKILLDAGAVPQKEDDLMFNVPGFSLLDYAADKKFVADWKRANRPPPKPRVQEPKFLLAPLPKPGN